MKFNKWIAVTACVVGAIAVAFSPAGASAVTGFLTVAAVITLFT